MHRQSEADYPPFSGIVLFASLPVTIPRFHNELEMIKELHCNTANLETLDWSYRWKIRTDKVACESTCILY